MLKSQTTKKALFIAAMALLLCVAMLTGTTFAWFTDQETSGNNQIIAGNLDVKLLHTDATGTTAEVTNQTTLFDDVARWEPGAVVWENLTVENAGNLALKYLLNVNMTSENKYKDANDKEYALSDILYVEIAEDANGDAIAFTGTRADAIALFDDDSMTLAEFYSNYAATGELEPKAEGATENPSETHGIIIYWKPSDNDNLYNMNNGKNKELSLEIGVILNATQLDNEEDAFGKDYDEGLEPLKSGTILESFADGSSYFRTDEGLVLYDTKNVTTADYTVPEGIVKVGDSAFGSNTAVKNVVFSDTVEEIGYQAFKGSAVESVTLNEGIVEIAGYAFNGAKNLSTFNIPSTVTTIGERAFRSTAATELTIPANVTTINDSFRDMPNLTTVTIEGNPTIANYAFRSCASLTTVYINGNPTFTGTSMVFSNADSGKSDNITIYVKSQEVADAVKAANGSCTGYTVVVDTNN